MRVVLGEWRDHEGHLEGLDEAQYCVHVILTSGPIFKARPNLGQKNATRAILSDPGRSSFISWSRSAALLTATDGVFLPW